MTNRGKRTSPSTKQADYERAVAAIKHVLTEGHYEGGMLPSYRQLVRDLNITMASVRRAMAQLEREGLIRRERGRGTLPLSRSTPAAPQAPVSLQCINILAYSLSFMPSFVEADYLAGYTEALDYLADPMRIRFVAGNELDSGNKQLFSPVLPISAQGVVLLNTCSPELIEWLQRSNVPFVVQYFSQYVTKGLPAHFSVYVNKSGGAYQAVQHLLELGHRKIGYMGPLKPDIPLEDMVYEGYRLESAAVFEGYRAALICAGLECVEDNLADCNHATSEKQEMFAMAKTFLERPQRPTAILTACDDYAYSLLEAARALRIRVPEDLSIVGFDNQPITKQAVPHLTTVSVPRRELASNAVKLLLEAAETPRVPPRTQILDTHLIIRKTTARPRADQVKNSADSFSLDGIPE